MDQVAFDYFYHQVNYDLINDKIPELVYPKYKNQVTGLCITSMYIKMLEHNEGVEILMGNYRKYVPKVYVKEHSFAIKKLISKTLKSISTSNCDSVYACIEFGI